ncbi:hypothetical protein LMH73_008705 [Vibrio splendidus]|nr:hypothetical protein [Vibrio splendidus]MCC4879453.1 hypothetical protein [Vibrio splendidus]
MKKTIGSRVINGNELLQNLIKEGRLTECINTIFKGKEFGFIRDRVVVNNDGELSFVPAALYYQDEDDPKFLSEKHSDLITYRQVIKFFLSNPVSSDKLCRTEVREKHAVLRLVSVLLKVMIIDIQRANSKLITKRMFPKQ